MPRPIAIVGIAAELPSGTYSQQNLDHAAFFEFLLNGGQAYEPMPSTRFDFQAWKGNGLGQISVETGSFLKDIDLFDPVEFGISSRDARAMAPATRKLLEQSFLALLDSGVDYRKKRVGCYMAANSIELSNVSEPDEYDARGSFALVPAMVANRISNHLDLLGPSIPVDTACSSSQTAFHLAIQTILGGDCEMAVVGGCQLNHRVIDWLNYSQSGVLSPDGKCKPFDASADGFGRAEGCVAVVLKPLEDALRDHDRVYATVLGTASNSTGSAGPPGAPIAEAQMEAMKIAFKRADKQPTEVAYVEVHATGTSKGDPTEANWVGEHFQRSSELLIGSVKGNIGHTEITAFLASLSKVLSIFEHGIIPPNVNLAVPNPAIKWREYNFRVPTGATPLPAATSGKTLISMSSSGIGGSNGHVVLEAPPQPLSIPRSEAGVGQPVLLMAAGLSPRSAAAIADQVSEAVDGMSPSEYAAAATILGRRAKQMSWRSCALSIPGVALPEFSKPQYSGRDTNPLVFVFSGQGPQHEAMGRELFRAFATFRDSILEMDAVFTRVTTKSVIHDYGLFGSSSPCFEFPDIWPISLTLPAIAMFQMALFDLLVSLGVRPDVVLGHSAGETAVLYASGAASKAMALELAIIRGRVFAPLEKCGGTMAAISCTAEQADVLLAQHRLVASDSVVELACINSDSAVAIAGHEQAIDAVLKLAEQAGFFGRKIRTRVPIHSSMMDLCRDRYRTEVEELFARYPEPHVPRVRTYSTLTGKVFPDAFDAEYFWATTRSQVLFAPAIHNFTDATTFVEIAPHPVLSSYVSDLATHGSTVLSSVRRPKSGGPSMEYSAILKLLGDLTCVGYNCVNFSHLNGALCSESTIKFKSYPFLKRPFPLYPDATRASDVYHGPINRSRMRLNRDTHPTMAEHVIRGEPIWPAAGFLEMALEFGAAILFDVKFRSILPLSSETPLPVSVSLDGAHWKVTSSAPSRPGQPSRDANNQRLHAEGYLSFEVPPIYEDLNIVEIRERCSSHVDSDFYPDLSYFSSYGPKFQRITNLYYNRDEALASIRGEDISLRLEHSYILHPAILDACFQIAAYRPFVGDFAPDYYHLPSRIQEMILHQPPKSRYLPPHVYAHITVLNWRPDAMRYQVAVVDDLGKRLCTLKFESAKHRIAPLRQIFSPLHLVDQPAFHAIRESSTAKGTCESANSESACGRAHQDLASERFRNALASYCQAGLKRVLKICIFTHLSDFAQKLFSVINEFSTLSIELFLSEASLLPEVPYHPCIIVRQMNDSVDTSSWFDIIVAQTDESQVLSAKDFLAHCDRLILPGGTLVLFARVATHSRGPILELTDNTTYSEYADFLKIHLRYAILHAQSVRNSATFSLDAQKPVRNHVSADGSALYDEDLDFVFDYRLGNEAQLQWDFSGLNPSQALRVWILAIEGPDAAAGSGLARALRREYLFWSIHFVTFPDAFSKKMRKDCLVSLPRCLTTELDLVFSSSGEVLTPRLVPLTSVAQQQPQAISSTGQRLEPDEALISIHRVSAYPQFSAVVGCVIQAHEDSEYESGSPVVGLQPCAVNGETIIDLNSMCIAPTHHAFDYVDLIPGIVTSLLAVSSIGNKTRRLNARSILVTHCDTGIGSVICEVYSQEGLKFSSVTEAVTLLALTRMGATFDTIVSGYDDKIHIQTLQSLLRPSRGRLFLWHRELPQILRDDPCRITQVLRVAFLRGYHQIKTPANTSFPGPPLEVSTLPVSTTFGAVFNPEKVYVLVGGMGNIGAHIALYMVEHGARHIVMTSRSGDASLLQNKNLIARRIFSYLRSLASLDISIAAVDATSVESMHNLFDSIDREIAGCIILTATTVDNLFPALGQNDFLAVFASKIRVIDTLQRTIDTSPLDFVVAFSSMTSTFGTGGQANYCAANAALEERMMHVPNGFSFICPAILDSSMMQSHLSSLKHLTDWAISMDEMILWLDDAIRKHQNGVKIQRYMPDLDWEIMNRTHGMPQLGAHLVPSSRKIQSNATEGESVAIKTGRIIRDVLNVPEEDFDSNMPLTSYGIDSLSAGRLSFALRSMVEVTQLQLMADNSLGDILRKFPTSAPSLAANEQAAAPRKQQVSNDTLMNQLVLQYSERLSNLTISSTRNHHIPAARTVLLTGSTGALGCHILAQLLADENVQHVYAFNRPSKDGLAIRDRQLSAFHNQGLSPALLESVKLTLLVGELDQQDLGISSNVLDELLSTVTQIIHNAWRVDFMARLYEFEDLIRGTYRLLQFALESKAPSQPTFSFISTIAVSRNLPATIAKCPEDPIEDAKVAVQTGYAESKWVSERLVQIASHRRLLDTNVIRVGLLTGSASGSWDTSHWVPALIQSGMEVGCLPEGKEMISWLPIHHAAAAIVDMQDTMNQTLHLIHPRPTTWNAVLKPAAVLLGVPLVPYAEWFSRLKATAESAPRGNTLMALKLLDFFSLGLKPAANSESMGLLPHVASIKGIQASPSLTRGEFPSLGADDVEKWLRYWRDVGFLRQGSHGGNLP